MAEQTNPKSSTKAAKKEEFRISKEIDDRLDVIKKNIEFCNENGTPEALNEGGKYYRSFTNLIEQTVGIIFTEIKKRVTGILPVARKDKGEEMARILQKILDDSKVHFADLTKRLDEEGIKKGITECEKRYSDQYANYHISRIS